MVTSSLSTNWYTVFWQESIFCCSGFFLTIIDGKITEEWVGLDTIGLMQQIGAIPVDAHASSSNARS